MIRSTIKGKVNVFIEVGDTIDGKDVPRDMIEVHNLVMDAGLLHVLTDGAMGFNTIGYGTGTTAPTGSDTTLETSAYSDDITLPPTTDTSSGMAYVTYFHYLGSVAGALGNITEAGLFAATTTLMARVVFGAINKTATTYIKTVWMIALTSEEL